MSCTRNFDDCLVDDSEPSEVRLGREWDFERMERFDDLTARWSAMLILARWHRGWNNKATY